MNGLVSFAVNRHCLTEEEQRKGDQQMLAVERTAWINVWAVDVLTLANAGKIGDAVSMLLKGPRDIHIGESVNVSYARLRHDAAPGVQVLFDLSFMTTQHLSSAKLREFDELKRALVAKWKTWWAQLPPITGEQHEHA